MSLINDALKKAQKQRTGDNTPLSAMPSVGGESASRIAKRDKPVGFNSMLLRLGLGAGVVLLVAIGGYFVMRAPRPAPENRAQRTADSPTKTTPTVAKTDPPVSPTVSSATVEPTPSSILRPPSSETVKQPAPSAAGFTLPVVTPPPPTPEPVVVKKPTPVATAKPSSASNSQPSTLNSQPAVAQPPLKLDSKAITYIESLRVAGIRASAADSKVLMNDRVYRIGDIVEHEMNLKLVGITANSMTFEDEHGGRYTRQF